MDGGFRYKVFRFHDLRQTFASHLVMAGVDLTTVKTILGHKTLTMTLRYAHLAPSHTQNALPLLDQGLSVANKTAPPDRGRDRFPHMGPIGIWYLSSLHTRHFPIGVSPEI